MTKNGQRGLTESTATFSRNNLLKRGDFRLASWNLQGGLQSGHAWDLVGKDLDRRSIAVACLQRARASGTELIDVNYVQMFYISIGFTN